MFILNPLSKSIVLLLSTFFLSSCSQNGQAVIDTFKFAVQNHDDVTLTQEEVNAFPYASLYAKKQKGPRVMLVLAYADKKHYAHAQNTFQLKWTSNSNEFLVTEFGRIVKTLNFADGNIQRSYSKSPDPLSLGLLNPSTPKSWKRFIDWQPGNYNHIALESTFTIAQQEHIDINGQTHLTQHVIENVNVPSLNMRYQNQFWLDLQTQEIIASIQRPAPLITEIETQILKPFNGG